MAGISGQIWDDDGVFPDDRLAVRNNDAPLKNFFIMLCKKQFSCVRQKLGDLFELAYKITGKYSLSDLPPWCGSTNPINSSEMLVGDV